jgi:hypothetical protein
VANERTSEPLPYGDVRSDIDAAARRATSDHALPADFAARLDRERARFALRTADTDDIRAALALLEEQTDVQPLAPVDSRNAGVAAAKRVVRKAVFFAMHHLAEQLQALGWAATAVGTAAAERIEALEQRVSDLEARLAQPEPPAGDPPRS